MMQAKRGDSKIGCIFWILIFAVIFYTAYCWGKAQWDYETMKEIVVFYIKGAVNSKPSDYIKVKEALLEKAEKETSIEFYDDDVIITGNREKGVTIDVYWEVPIKFPGYSYILKYSIVKTAKRN